MTYLSLAPEGLREAFITGGAARRSGRRDRRRLPRDLRAHARAQPALLRALPGGPRAACSPSRERLEGEDVRLPARRPPDRRAACASSGDMLGMSDGAEQLHYLLELPPDSPGLPARRRGGVGVRAQPALRDPPRGVLGRRRRDALVGAAAAARRLRGQPELFTGEHVYPWMFEEYGALAPLREAAEHPRRARVAAPLRPRAARGQRGAGRRGDLRRRHVRRARLLRGDGGARSAACAPWLTSEYEHNGLRADGDRMLGRLIDLARGRACGEWPRSEATGNASRSGGVKQRTEGGPSGELGFMSAQRTRIPVRCARGGGGRQKG